MRTPVENRSAKKPKRPESYGHPVAIPPKDGEDDRAGTRTNRRTYSYRRLKQLALRGFNRRTIAGMLGVTPGCITRAFHRHPELVPLHNEAIESRDAQNFEVAYTTIEMLARSAQKKAKTGAVSSIEAAERDAVRVLATRTKMGRERLATRTEFVGKDGGPVVTAQVDTSPARVAALIRDEFRLDVAANDVAKTGTEG